MNGAFITGTNTGIGKTFFTAAWTRHLRANGIPALALKPIACGDRTDAETFANANDEILTLNEINPIHLAPPLSPYAACVVEDKPFDWEPWEKTKNELSKRFPGPFLIEGVGGWLVPITRDFWVRDWALELGLPVVVVASAGLGTLNHTLLTIESIRPTGLPILGIVVNAYGVPDDLAAATNPAFLEDLTGLPVWNLPAPGTVPQWPKWLSLSTVVEPDPPH
ncbi:MAG: dethiobiotin synthase [Candidatus Methylacidiphilales bacterium]